MPDSDWWDQVAKKRDERNAELWRVKYLEIYDDDELKALVRALQHHWDYLRATKGSNAALTRILEKAKRL